MPFEPFIVTAALPPNIHSWADGLRTAHYPAERNHLRAHVTLFHALAPSLFAEVQSVIPSFARDNAPPSAEINGLLKWDTGTAIALDSPAMLAIREDIADHFHGSLTAQDLHEPRLHITVQNKVTPRQAKMPQAELEPQIERRTFCLLYTSDAADD